MAEKLVSTIKQETQTLKLWESTDRNLEIFIDGAQGVTGTGHTVKLNLFTRRFDSTPEVENRDVACRLVMGIDTFFSLVDFLNGTSEQLKKTLNINTVKPSA